MSNNGISSRTKIRCLSLYVEISQSIFLYLYSLPSQEYTIATFHETLRHFPSVARLGKPVHADTTLKAKRFTTNIQHIKPKSTDLHELSNVEEFVVPIPKGSIVIVDIFALHFNRTSSSCLLSRRFLSHVDV